MKTLPAYVLYNETGVIAGYKMKQMTFYQIRQDSTIYYTQDCIMRYARSCVEETV